MIGGIDPQTKQSNVVEQKSPSIQNPNKQPLVFKPVPKPVMMEIQQSSLESLLKRIKSSENTVKQIRGLFQEIANSAEQISGSNEKELLIETIKPVQQILQISNAETKEKRGVSPKENADLGIKKFKQLITDLKDLESKITGDIESQSLNQIEAVQAVYEVHLKSFETLSASLSSHKNNVQQKVKNLENQITDESITLSEDEKKKIRIIAKIDLQKILEREKENEKVQEARKKQLDTVKITISEADKAVIDASLKLKSLREIFQPVMPLASNDQTTPIAGSNQPDNDYTLVDLSQSYIQHKPAPAAAQAQNKSFLSRIFGY